jgi:hypothetical protein
MVWGGGGGGPEEGRGVRRYISLSRAHQPLLTPAEILIHT